MKINNAHKPTLYIFSGLPGSGKSTLAINLSQYNKASYLRIDTIEQALKDECKISVYDHGYKVAFCLASDNLQHGMSVIADACNTNSDSRSAWQKVALDAQANIINILVFCSDTKEHQHRVEQRIPAVKGLILPSWEQVKAREFEPWTSTVIAIDTAGKTPAQTFNDLLEQLNEFNNITKLKE